jgi:hypothetical protein
MTTKSVSTLPVPPFVAGGDTVVIVKGGLFHRTTVDGLKQGMDVAAPSGKGLMSAADKLALDSIGAQLGNLLNQPSTPIASAATITIPPGRYHITLTGTTNVVNVIGLVPRALYTIDYPSGAGLEFRNEPMLAGDSLLIADL